MLGSPNQGEENGQAYYVHGPVRRKGHQMRYLLAAFLSLALSAAALAREQSREAERLQSAAEVITEIMGTPEKGIPRDLLKKAVCVGIIPSEKKGALGIGGSFGRGCLVCRRGGDGPWGAPSMFTVGGVNFGFQLGGQATDFEIGRAHV